MQDSGGIFSAFRTYLTGNIKKLINVLPITLREESIGSLNPLYPPEIYSEIGVVPYTFKGIDYYLDENEDTYNVVVIGPTGAGKSRLINAIFNMNICESRASLYGVTREISFIRGEAIIDKKRKDVVLVDTMGFCDPLPEDKSAIPWSDDLIVKFIKSRIEANMLKIHVVLFVLPQRIEPQHHKNITKFMKWLRFDEHYANFMFVINKCDGLPKTELKKLCADAEKIFGLRYPTVLSSHGKKYDTIVTTGFPQPDLIEGPKGKAQITESFRSLSVPLFVPPVDVIQIEPKCWIL